MRFVLQMLCVAVCCAPCWNSECGFLCYLYFVYVLSDASGDYIVETYSNISAFMALYVASIGSFCFPNVVDVSAVLFCVPLL